LDVCDLHPILSHDAVVVARVVDGKIKGSSSVSNREQIQVIVIVNVDEYGRAPCRRGEQIFESAALIGGAFSVRGFESMQVTTAKVWVVQVTERSLNWVAVE
jgi:hypothetical protein